MLTLKKIALIGAAGLAAFSMSCSDSEGGDTAGSWSVPFNATFASSTIALSGTIVADPIEDSIASVTLTAGSFTDDQVFNGVGLLTPFPSVLVVLDGTYAGINQICDGATGAIDVEVSVKATFQSGATLTDSKTVNVTCGAAVIDPNLVRKTLTLSAAGTSYYDLDAGEAYTQAQIADKKEKIDLVAYNGQVGKSGNVNSIYNPLELDIFYNADYSETYFGDVAFFTIPEANMAAAVGALSAAQKVSDLELFLPMMDLVLDADPVTEIPIVKNTAFIVFSTEADETGKGMFAIIITDNGVQTVDLTSISMPSE